MAPWYRAIASKAFFLLSGAAMQMTPAFIEVK
jgi:hypothetical protein